MSFTISSILHPFPNCTFVVEYGALFETKEEAEEECRKRTLKLAEKEKENRDEFLVWEVK